MKTMQHWLAAAIAILSVPSYANAQQQLVGEAGGWVVFRMDRAECWMLTGTSSALFAISLTRDLQPSVIFTVKYNGTPPSSLPIAIQILNSPFLEKPRMFRGQFTMTKKKGNEFFYQARLTGDQLALVQAHKYITFTEVPGNGPAANITAAFPTNYDRQAISVWRDCAANL